MLDVVAFLLLKPVTKFLSRKIFGDNTLGFEMADSAIDYAKDKFVDFRKAQEASRKIEDLASSLVKQLADFAEQEHLDPHQAEQIAQGLLTASTALDLGREIAKAGRQPALLAKTIATALPAGVDMSDELTGLMVVAFADGLCRIAASLPEYERGKDQELFRELDALIAGQASFGRDLTLLRGELSAIVQGWQNEKQEQLAAVDQNEQQYRSALHRFASQVKLLGLEGDRHEAGRELPIETAYVPLRLRARDPGRTPQQDGDTGLDDFTAIGGESDITWPEVLSLLPHLGNKLLVEGIGGSGKSTLLQWTAVQALRAEGSGNLRHQVLPATERLERFRKGGVFGPIETSKMNAPDQKAALPWFKRVPLFIRLRDCTDGRLPSPQELPGRIAKTALGTSEEWVRQVVNEGRALFLVDGIDEVPGEARDRLGEDIEAYLRDYSGCALIATSRPPAVQDRQWAHLFGSCRLAVERMARPEIEAFVRHWYKSYGIVREEPHDETAVARLLGQLKARPGLIGLMDTPLLAASICFLNKDRTEELPTRAPELYNQLCRQLVHQLDEERLKKSGYEALVPALRGLEPDQKLYLLSELAQLMINNRCAALEVDQAVSRIKQGLQQIGREHGRVPRDVLDALQERSGLLRGSTPVTVEFAHNNLRGWLAAHAFAQESEHVLPIERAFDLKDFDLPVLAASQSNKIYRHRLIDECLNFAERQPENSRVAMIMALRCGQVGAIDPSHRSKLDVLVEHILPPLSSDEATWLAELGEAVIPRLAAVPDRDKSIDSACVRCLRLIGGSASKAMMLEYLQHQDEAVVDELAQALPPLSIPHLNGYIFSKWHREPWQPAYYPARHVTSVDLTLACEDLVKLRDLCLDDTDIEDLGFLLDLEDVCTLSFRRTKVTDLGPLRGLTALQSLSLDSTQVTDLEPLCNLTALRRLSFCRTQVSDLQPLRELTALQYLSLDETQTTDLKVLRGLTELQDLSFNNTQVNNLEPLRELTALEKLRLDGTHVADLEPLRGISALQHLSFTSIQTNNLQPLRGLFVLRELWLDETQVVDLEPLSGLTALQQLWLDNTQVVDLEPLSGLTALQQLSFEDTQVADLKPLRRLTSLQELYLNRTQVTDLDPLNELTALQELWFDDTEVADLEPLRGLTALRVLSFDNTPAADLEPLSGLTALRTVWFVGTKATDFEPLYNLTSLESIWIHTGEQLDLEALRRRTS